MNATWVEGSEEKKVLVRGSPTWLPFMTTMIPWPFIHIIHNHQNSDECRSFVQISGWWMVHGRYGCFEAFVAI